MLIIAAPVVGRFARPVTPLPCKYLKPTSHDTDLEKLEPRPTATESRTDRFSMHAALPLPDFAITQEEDTHNENSAVLPPRDAPRDASEKPEPTEEPKTVTKLEPVTAILQLMTVDAEPGPSMVTARDIVDALPRAGILTTIDLPSGELSIPPVTYFSASCESDTQSEATALEKPIIACFVVPKIPALPEPIPPPLTVTETAPVTDPPLPRVTEVKLLASTE